MVLERLNERGRHYGTVLWQVPFACLGLAGVGVAAVEAGEHRRIAVKIVDDLGIESLTVMGVDL